jgi:hypothetical protein
VSFRCTSSLGQFLCTPDDGASNCSRHAAGARVGAAADCGRGFAVATALGDPTQLSVGGLLLVEILPL